MAASVSDAPGQKEYTLAEAKQPAAQSVTFTNPDEVPVYGTEYVRPTNEDWKTQPPQENPLWEFQMEFKRVPWLDGEGNQVGYIDLRDLHSKDATVWDVKDKDGNVVGTVSPTRPYRAVPK